MNDNTPTRNDPSPAPPDGHSPRTGPRPLKILRNVLSILFFCLGAALLLMAFPICQSDERFFAGVIFALAGLFVIGIGILVMDIKKRRP